MANDILLFHKFLEMGLIPEDSILQKNRDAFIEKMKSLSLADQRQAKRKFRKVFKKALNFEIRKIMHSESSSFVKQKRVDNLKEACGVGCKKLLERHHNRRRFIVRSFLIEELKK